jgi:hypothetical protein
MVVISSCTLASEGELLLGSEVRLLSESCLRTGVHFDLFMLSRPALYHTWRNGDVLDLLARIFCLSLAQDTIVVPTMMIF